MKIFNRFLGHLVSCKDVSRWLARAPELPLSTSERIKVRWHLAVCRVCRALDQQLRFLREAMRRYRE